MATSAPSTYQLKTIPFYGDIDQRDGQSYTKDQVFVNTYCESQKTGDSKRLLVRKRPGLQLFTNHAPGVIRGAFSASNRMWYAVGNQVIELVGNVPTGIFSLSTSSGPVGFVLFPYQGDDQTYLIAADGTNLYMYNIGTNTYTGVMPTGFPTPHIPQPIVIDDYLCVAKAGTGDVYSTQLEDITAAWDFLSAELYPDNIIGLSRYNNYIAVMGTNSVEFFYDAANTTGSPFSRNDSFVCPIGCAAPYATVAIDQKLIWVGETNEGGRSVWAMQDTKPVEISNTFIKQILEVEGGALASARAYSIRSNGHQFYVLCLAGTTWAFDFKELTWSRWEKADTTFPQYAFDGGVQGYPFLLEIDGIYLFTPFCYMDGVSIMSVEWQTDMLDLGNMSRKFAHRLTLTNNVDSPTAIIFVQWTDDDYQTYSTGKNILISDQRPSIVNMGYFRRRAYKFVHADNSPLTTYSMELYYNQGSN